MNIAINSDSLLALLMSHLASTTGDWFVVKEPLDPEDDPPDESTGAVCSICTTDDPQDLTHASFIASELNEADAEFVVLAHRMLPSLIAALQSGSES